MPNARPFVAAACICEKVLQDADGVASLIRIVDTYRLGFPDAPIPPGTRVALDLQLYVSIKSGDVTGQHELGLLLRQPNGKSPDPRRWPIVLNGGEHGTTVTISFQLAAKPG